MPINNNLLKSTQKSGNALIFPCDQLTHLLDQRVSNEMEKEMIDYFLTGGKLLQKELGDTESVNEDYIQVISDLFHYKNGQFDAIEKKRVVCPTSGK